MEAMEGMINVCDSHRKETVYFILFYFYYFILFYFYFKQIEHNQETATEKYGKLYFCV